ncbi:T9SS type A sorting domain-containing protein [Mangrovimonas sp. DI 80]|uniref:T9SS type A sorting domain-containing protein n=1 Tax=Mangrovimonas sp. DI 80 TaxID=1779330 RepID=UPI0009FB3BA6|nr:T9SS type A sorting domain-containing protein [Mangrovimonas sp. DI 80]
MKKVTLLMLLLFSSLTFSQVFIDQPFDESTKPADWTYDGTWISNSTVGACTSGALNGYGIQGTTHVVTTNTQVSNGTEMNISYDYNVVHRNPRFTFPAYGAPEANWGSVVIDYSTNGTDWTTLQTIDDSNFTYDGSCKSATYTIDAATLPAETNFQFRATFNIVNDSNQLYFSLDNVLIAQTATEVPNCDATISSELTNVPIENTTITWNKATGIPTGYKLAVGLVSGDYTFVASTDVGNTTSFTFPENLEYSTTYYVLITPYNTLGDATGCAVQSFTTRDAPLQGAACSDPIIIDIDSGDFSATGVSLNLYEDDYDTAPCNAGSGSSMAGNEMVYAIAPIFDVSVDIALTNIINQRANIYVLDSCVDVATECIASGATGYGKDDNGFFTNLLLEDVVLIPGNIYYIVISTGQNYTENNTQFDLSITKNPCINPSATLTPVADCENGKYSVQVDVTYFGDATTLTISDGVEEQTLDAIGAKTFGPYDNSSTQSFTITSDLGCNITESITYYCPPVNDECANAIALTLSTDENCDNSVSGYTYEATDSTQDVCFSSYQDVWYTFTPSEDGYYQFVVTTDLSSNRISVLSGSCDTEFSAVGTCGSSYSVIRLLSAGTQYYIPVQSVTAASIPGMDFTLCVYKMPDAVANDECSAAQVITESDASGSNTITGTHENAYYSMEMANCGSGLSSYYEDVWYSFTPQYTGTYHINLDILTGSNVFYSMFSTSDCASVSTDNRVTSTCSVNGNSSVDLVAGTTYLLDIHSNSNSEIATFSFFIYPDATLSNAEVNFEGFRYYPNPVKNTLTFESPNVISSVAIYNVVGQKVLATAGNNTMSTVNMSALPNGIYFAKVNIDGTEKTIKIIKE